MAKSCHSEGGAIPNPKRAAEVTPHFSMTSDWANWLRNELATRALFDQQLP
jgi:hypothetical protein